MITGYNNDIKYRGTVFHVQTEDKGEASAWIESLIYTGGRILARKRVTYKQLLDEGADKPAIAKLMERQHRLMIRQIREGRFDSETPDGAEPGAKSPAEDDSDIHTARIQQQAKAMFAPTEEGEAPVDPPTDMPEPTAAATATKPPATEGAPLENADDEAPTAEMPPAEPPSEAGPVTATGVEAPDAESLSTQAAEAHTATEAASAAEEPSKEAAARSSYEIEAPPPPEIEPPSSGGAVDQPSDPEFATGPTPTLDQVIFDYLSSVAQEESLVLLMDESPALASATTTRMDLGTHASRSGKPIANAVIAVRMISKTGGPVTLAEGTTDEDGTLQLLVEVPEVERDAAALIITAASSIGNAEIKHLL